MKQPRLRARQRPATFGQKGRPKPRTPNGLRPQKETRSKQRLYSSRKMGDSLTELAEDDYAGLGADEDLAAGNHWRDEFVV